MVIKPAGVDYVDLRPELMVISDLEGSIVDGDLMLVSLFAYQSTRRAP